MLSGIFADCRYADCHYAECRYAENHGTFDTPNLSLFELAVVS
jgi:hypothetical protein